LPKKEFKRPDEAVMQQILKDNRGSVAELALRLAWNAGLSREEMYNLKWSDISPSEKMIYLPDRAVPIEDEEVLCLERRIKTGRGRSSEYLMASDRNHTHMAPQSISRAARDALNRGGLTDITLVDLRQDYVIRLLEKHDWPYVAKVSGTAVATLYAQYGKYYTNGRGVKPERKKTKPDEFKLWKIVEAEGSSCEGLSLWMAWKLGMQMQEIIDLTWEQVDLNKGIIVLPDRQIEMTTEFVKRLSDVKKGRDPESDPHVLLTPRSKHPYDLARLSRILRTVMIRGGLEGVSFKDIVPDAKRENEDERILRCAMKHGSVTRNDVIKLLGLTKNQAFNRLRALVDRGELIKIGAKYFVPGTVVPPEEQYEVLSAHLEVVGSSFRKELADILHLDGKQCSVILRKLVAEGKLVRKGQLYTLPEGTKK